MFQTDFHAKINECLVNRLEFKVNFWESTLMIPAHVDVTIYDWDKSTYWIHSFDPNNLRRLSSIGGGLSKWDLRVLSSEFPSAGQKNTESYIAKWLRKYFVRK